jgi:hypothetical protein
MRQRSNRSGVRRGERFDGERVDVALQKIINCRVDQTVPRDSGYSSKRLGHNPYPKVTLAARCACVAFVTVTLIYHL